MQYCTWVPRFHGSPLTVDVDNDFDNNKDQPLGGQIVSPHQWDHRPLAQKAGHSLLDAAALGYQEYQRYERRYSCLTMDIIFCCGYRDPMVPG